jgi:hypothetical protein
MPAPNARWSAAKTIHLLAAVAGAVLAAGGIVFGLIHGFTWTLVVTIVIGIILMVLALYFGFLRRPRPPITLKER